MIGVAGTVGHRRLVGEVAWAVEVALIKTFPKTLEVTPEKMVPQSPSGRFPFQLM